jgi:hypothetical protein
MENGTEKVEIPEESPQKAEAAVEENVPGLMPEVEHAHGLHGHESGIRWLDVIVTVSVVFISLLSLVVSIEHGKSMEKMVDQNQKLVVASTLPILTIGGRQFDDSAKPMFQVTISNSGVGPAIIDRFEIRYKGVVYSDHMALLRACCGAALIKSQKSGHPQIFFSTISGHVLPARQDFYPITIKPDQDGLDLYRAFERVRNSDDLTFHACYCSVLDECWETNFDHKRPQPVNKCQVSPNEKLW